MQIDLLKGVLCGENIYNLFLKACTVIALMTNNHGFYTQIEADIKAIYGDIFQEKALLQKELEEEGKSNI